MADDVTRMRQTRVPGVPLTHLAFLRFRIPCRDPEAIARCWGVLLGSEPEALDANGNWYLGANIGNSGASFDFYSAPEKMTDLSRLVLDVLTEDLGRTSQLATERGGTVEKEGSDKAGRLVWRRVVDAEGNIATLFQVDDLDAWWTRDVEGRPWPPAGAARHLNPGEV
jgi:Glyoxalase-like domain